MTRARGSIALLTVLALATLTGCSSSDGSSDDTGATPTPEATASIDESAACAYLTSADRRKLAGVALDTVVAADAKDHATQCRWSSDKGVIQVTSLPAQAWAKTLPEIVANIEKSSQQDSKEDRADLAKAKKLLAGADGFTGAEACSAFATLARIGGSKAGTRTTVSYLPITDTEVGISAQTCSGGVLTSLVYSEPGLIESKKYDTSIRVAIAAAHRRAVADLG